ncbi:MAG: NADH-quinone oxidoreductase subunit J, partial [Planctomycetes bacterium]|nr:NADH-quinone oxidoreductase subunit J [Planctomycetota bacterium]
MTPTLIADVSGVALPVAAINWHALFFLLFAGIACGFAVAVVAADNVVRMALYLVLSLAATAGLFLLAGAEFLGAMQLMIYVGGTLVLLVFGVMLTAQGPLVTLASAGGDRALAGVVGAALLGMLVLAGLSVPAWRQPASGAVVEPAAAPLGMALVGVRVDDPTANAPAGVRPGYLLPFEIVSVHLLVVLVGAAYLARAKRRKTPRAIEVAASVEPPAAVAEHAAIGRDAALRTGS